MILYIYTYKANQDMETKSLHKDEENAVESYNEENTKDVCVEKFLNSDSATGCGPLRLLAASSSLKSWSNGLFFKSLSL